MLSKKRFLDIYGRFYDEFHSPSPLDANILPHAAYRITGIETSSFHVFALNTGLDNHVTNAINGINRFIFLILRLHAWHRVHESLEDEVEQREVTFEQTMPLTAEALARPYSIKSSLLFSIVEIFAIPHRIHEMQEPKIDRLRLKPSSLDLCSSLAQHVGISGLSDFRSALEEINGQEYRALTNNFRNRSHHGLEPYIDIGDMPLLTFWKDNDAQGYRIGSEPALSTDELFPILEDEHAKCVSAFKPFWILVCEIQRTLPDERLGQFRIHSNRKLPDETV